LSLSLRRRLSPHIIFLLCRSQVGAVQVALGHQYLIPIVEFPIPAPTWWTRMKIYTIDLLQNKIILENNFSIKTRTLSGETTSATSVAFVLVLVASRKHHLVLIKSLILLLFDFILLIRFSILFSPTFPPF
jgi:hypothetical protein